MSRGRVRPKRVTANDEPYHDLAEAMVPARDFVQSVQGYIQECYADGPPHKNDLNMAKTSILNLVKTRQQMTAAKARASCVIKLPNGREPRTAIQSPPGGLNVPQKMITECLNSRLNGGEFVLKLSRWLCKLMTPRSRKDKKLREGEWDAMMGLIPRDCAQSQETKEFPGCSTNHSLQGLAESALGAAPPPTTKGGLESVPQTELRAFYAAYGHSFGIDVARAAILVFGSVKTATPWLEHLLVRRKDKDVARPSMWEELVFKAAATWDDEPPHADAEIETRTQQLQEIFGCRLPVGLARQAAENCPSVEAAIQWIQPMFDGYDPDTSDSEETMIDAEEDWSSREGSTMTNDVVVVDDDDDGSASRGSADEIKASPLVKLRLRNDRDAQPHLRTAISLEAMANQCRAASEGEWETLRATLAERMIHLARDLEHLAPLLPVMEEPRRQDLHHGEPDSASSENEDDSNESESGETAGVMVLDTTRSFELKPINLTEAMPYISALPRDAWEKYQATLNRLHFTGALVEMDFKQRLSKIARILFEPEEMICLPTKDWARLRAAVRAVGMLTVATGDQSEGEVLQVGKTEHWVGNKLRYIATLESIKIEEESD